MFPKLFFRTLRRKTKATARKIKRLKLTKTQLDRFIFYTQPGRYIFYILSLDLLKNEYLEKYIVSTHAHQHNFKD